jgi:hypothetical protein
MEKIRELMSRLSPQQRQDVLDFALSLSKKEPQPKREKLRLDWAGGLAEFKGKYTSMKLQKESLNWWGD